jgi:hypothetical protein
MTAMASTVSGMSVTYDKEGIDPRKCHAVPCTAAHDGQRRKRVLVKIIGE